MNVDIFSFIVISYATSQPSFSSNMKKKPYFYAVIDELFLSKLMIVLFLL
jgi:hypothetical protein